MTPDTVRAALRAAAEFKRRADDLLKTATEDGFGMFDERRKSGALRRQSLELTRALTDMRKP